MRLNSYKFHSKYFIFIHKFLLILLSSTLISAKLILQWKSAWFRVWYILFLSYCSVSLYTNRVIIIFAYLFITGKTQSREYIFSFNFFNFPWKIVAAWNTSCLANFSCFFFLTIFFSFYFKKCIIVGRRWKYCQSTFGRRRNGIMTSQRGCYDVTVMTHLRDESTSMPY